MKKLLSIFFVFTLIFLQINTTKAFADTQSGDYTYSVSNSTAIITGYKGSDLSITIPSNIDGYTVTSIGNNAFYYCTNLTSITIPIGVTSIGDEAFSWCTNLTNIIIPDSVTSIGDGAFYNCSSLPSLTIPNSVTSIADGAFESCDNLTSITIPNSVTSIGNEAFILCHKLMTINVDAYNTVYSSLDGVLYNKLKTTLIYYPCGKTSPFVVPNSVTSIGDDAFKFCKYLSGITIPNNVTSIGDSAFCACSSLTNITIPNSVTSIPDRAFELCDNLTSITIPNSVTSIGDSAFNSCSILTNITIPNSITSIGDSAFRDCSSLTNITIPNSVTSISNCAFYFCSSLTIITIPNSVTGIGSSAFAFCSSLTSINVDAYNTAYSSLDGVLYNKLKTTLMCYPAGKTNSTFVVPSSVTNIGNEAFSDCSSLTSITISNSVTNIGDYAFVDCSSLASIIIPSSVTSIWNDYDVFYHCPSTLIIYYHNTAIGFTNPWNGYTTVPYNIVSYNGNGNTGGTVPVDNNIYTQGTQATIISNTGSLVKTGYTFSGWNTKADGSGTGYPASTSVSMNGADMTLYAQWTSLTKYTVTFDSNGGSTVSPITNISAGTTITLPTAPTKTGYTFSGWNTAADGSGTGFTAATPVNANKTLYAQWMSISPSSGTFTSTTPANLTAAITAPNKVANPVIGVYNGTTRLVAGTDEAIVPTTTGYTFTIYSSYLSKLTSNTPITLKFRDGSSLTYNVVLGATMSPTSGTFTKTAPANLTSVITAPNKVANPIVGVYNGTTRLVAGTDEAVVPTTTGYTFTLYSSYLSKLTSNTVITLKFRDGSSINYTVNVQ